MTESIEYAERVYSGVLGKIIGVYLGRPFEGWRHEEIKARLGFIEGFVHELLDRPLVVTDDDITGTFTFLRAIQDHGLSLDLTSAEIGKSWLNYIIELRSILWWGGFGVSTEHTAFTRLKEGIEAPASGSIELNGKTVAEQIGAQIFIDGWGLISPGDPERAASLAARAASVSHDGEAIHGAQMVAAMIAQAFIESNPETLIEEGLNYIPEFSLISLLIQDIRNWHRDESEDWERNFHRVRETYGYDRYRGGCHMVPNHALIILALLHGQGDFQRSLGIVNTCGWDTDCNSGNVGCILGVAGGLNVLDSGWDYRGPVADRLFLPQADEGRAITDAVGEAYTIVNIARSLDHLPELEPKDGACFHFSLPGSVQGFRTIEDHTNRGCLKIANGRLPNDPGSRSLELSYHRLATGCSAFAATQTWLVPEDFEMQGYSLDACPTLYPGQTIEARIVADPGNANPITVGLAIQTFNAEDTLEIVSGSWRELPPGQSTELAWEVPENAGYPIATVGIQLSSCQRTLGRVYLDRLTWIGTPKVTFSFSDASEPARRAWVFDAPVFGPSRFENIYWMSAYDRRGLAYQGSRQWTDCEARADLKVKLATSAGLLARVQGLRRFYALELTDQQTVRIIKVRHNLSVLAEASRPWIPEKTVDLHFTVTGNHLQGWIEGELILEADDEDAPLLDGAAGLTVVHGHLSATKFTVGPPAS